MKDKWVIFWDSGAFSRQLCSKPKQVVKETEKLIKFSRSGSWPRQIGKADFIAAYDSEAVASEALDKVKSAYKSSYETMTVPVSYAQSALNDATEARRKAVLHAVAQAVS